MPVPVLMLVPALVLMLVLVPVPVPLQRVRMDELPSCPPSLLCPPATSLGHLPHPPMGRV